jgi:K+-sensing histidine kinase KdpD
MFKSLQGQNEPKLNDKTIGMGLCISKMIVTKFNGAISFESVFKKGSRFNFYFDMEEYHKIPRNTNLELINSSAGGQNMVSFMNIEI